MSSKKDVLYSNEPWIENYLMPLVNILGCIEDIEVLIEDFRGLNFLKTKNFLSSHVRKLLIEIVMNLDSALKYPEVSENYSYIPWNKFIRIGKELEKAHCTSVHEKTWWMVSEAIPPLKKVVEKLLGMP